MQRFGGVSGATASAIAGLAKSIAANAKAIVANASAIKALGTPLRTDVVQSLTAAALARVLASLGVTYSIGVAGYISFFGLFVLQWATVSTGTGSTTSWVYPTTFPSACFGVVGTRAAATTDRYDIVEIASVSASSAFFFMKNGSGGGIGNSPAFLIAIGN